MTGTAGKQTPAKTQDGESSSICVIRGKVRDRGEAERKGGRRGGEVRRREMGEKAGTFLKQMCIVSMGNILQFQKT